jgi:hypothetical protein
MDTGNTMEKYALIAALSVRVRYAGNVSAAGWRAEILTIAQEICNVDGRYYEQGGGVA